MSKLVEFSTQELQNELNRRAEGQSKIDNLRIDTELFLARKKLFEKELSSIRDEQANLLRRAADISEIHGIPCVLAGCYYNPESAKKLFHDLRVVGIFRNKYDEEVFSEWFTL